MKSMLELYYLKLIFVIIYNIYIKRFISIFNWELQPLKREFIDALTILLLETIVLCSNF